MQSPILNVDSPLLDALQKGSWEARHVCVPAPIDASGWWGPPGKDPLAARIALAELVRDTADPDVPHYTIGAAVRAHEWCLGYLLSHGGYLVKHMIRHGRFCVVHELIREGLLELDESIRIPTLFAAARCGAKDVFEKDAAAVADDDADLLLQFVMVAAFHEHANVVDYVMALTPDESLTAADAPSPSALGMYVSAWFEGKRRACADKITSSLCALLGFRAMLPQLQKLLALENVPSHVKRDHLMHAMMGCFDGAGYERRDGAPTREQVLDRLITLGIRRGYTIDRDDVAGYLGPCALLPENHSLLKHLMRNHHWTKAGMHALRVLALELAVFDEVFACHWRTTSLRETSELLCAAAKGGTEDAICVYYNELKRVADHPARGHVLDTVLASASSSGKQTLHTLRQTDETQRVCGAAVCGIAVFTAVCTCIAVLLM